MTTRMLVDSGPLPDPLTVYADAARPEPPDRPWVLANMVSGLDGSVAVDGRVGPLSGGDDRRLFLRLRSVADVVLVGAETARAEDYGPVRLDDDLVAARRRAGRPDAPRLALVSRSLAIDPGARLFRDGTRAPRPLVITGADAPHDRRMALAAVAEVVVAGDCGVDFGAALRALRDRGVGVVLCEGGPAVLGQLLDRDLLDELCLSLAPTVGGDPLPVAVTSGSTSLARFALDHVLRADDDTLLLRYLRGSRGS